MPFMIFYQNRLKVFREAFAMSVIIRNLVV